MTIVPKLFRVRFEIRDPGLVFDLNLIRKYKPMGPGSGACWGDDFFKILDFKTSLPAS